MPFCSVRKGSPIVKSLMSWICRWGRYLFPWEDPSPGLRALRNV